VTVPSLPYSWFEAEPTFAKRLSTLHRIASEQNCSPQLRLGTDWGGMTIRAPEATINVQSVRLSRYGGDMILSLHCS
jgi:hypothetical protein